MLKITVKTNKEKTGCGFRVEGKSNLYECLAAIKGIREYIYSNEKDLSKEEITKAVIEVLKEEK